MRQLRALTATAALVCAVVSGMTALTTTGADAAAGKPGDLCDILHTCPTSPTTPSPTTPAPDPDAAPAVGSCHAMTIKEVAARSDPDRPVPCAGKHQSLTIKTLTLRAGTHRTDNDAINSQMGRACFRAAAARLGGWPAWVRSAYGLANYVPTQAQWNRGARWVRCDLILYAGRNALQPLPSTSQLDSTLTMRETWCRQGRSTGYASVACNRRHQFRATTTVSMSSWHGPKAAAKFAIRVCRKRFPTATFMYDYPHTHLYFSWGAHFAVCLPETKR